jgi:hypothetical protein
VAINQYINFYNATNEQDLYESLIIESIRWAGFDTYYMPKTAHDLDEIFRESTVDSFDQAIPVEAYLKSNMKFEGDGQFMSKHLGLEIRDQTTFTVSQKVFKELTSLDRPREGDLVYLPLDKKCYEIRFVEHQDVFYQLGKLMVWDLQCELIEYTGQKFNTGIAEIDSIPDMFDLEDAVDDWIDQSPEIEEEADPIIDFSEHNPFSQGEF